MQNTYLTSLIFAFLTTLSAAATAAPSIKSEPPTPITTQMTKTEQSTKVNRKRSINPTDVKMGGTLS